MNIKALILLFAIAVTGLSSCKKTSDTTSLALTTNINVVNASADTLNFYQNGTRLNNTTNLYPFGSLTNVNVIAGTQNYQFKKAGSSNTLIDLPLTIDSKTAHTLFVAGEAVDKVFLLRDTIVNDTVKNTAVIRFINASPIPGNLDIYIGSNLVYKNRAFKSATAYMQVNSGKNVLSIYQSGSTSQLIPSGTLTLVAGGIYTLYTKGVLNGTGNNAFGARILTL
ncbi:DUF4397 domain-containing protein [Mucilaginibacter sp.]|uniref:DUF4397 domain-containing protein n=1 Tax=Mucilaginibacter sp. TaxID=1882438 RepID=UPI00261AF7B2|nr:DUF4397 domain-containing protein [Mucilaginibacter sp.]MDB4924966.1 hypothetical protein [Mucilaginibacter sp.]